MALDDAAVRQPLRELVTPGRQGRGVPDPAGERRRYRDDGPFRRVRAGVRADPYALFLLRDRPYRLTQPYHAGAERFGQSLGELTHPANHAVLLRPAARADQRLQPATAGRVEQCVQQGNVRGRGGEDRLADDAKEVPAPLGQAGTAQPALERLPVEHLGPGSTPRFVQIAGASQPAESSLRLPNVEQCPRAEAWNFPGVSAGSATEQHQRRTVGRLRVRAQAEALQLTVEPILSRADPLTALVDDNTRVSGHLDASGPPADAVARLKYSYRLAGRDQTICGNQAGYARTDDDDVNVMLRHSADARSVPRARRGG